MATIFPRVVKRCRQAAILGGGLGILLTGTACRPSRDADPVQTGPAAPIYLDGTQWVVESLNGRSIIEGSTIRLNFTPDAVGGYSGCNWYGAAYTASGTNVQIRAPESTARGCLTPSGVGRQEEMFYQALQQVATYRVVDNRLEMLNRGNEAVLVMAPRARFAMNPADLIGTTWRLRSVNDTVRAIDSVLTLALTEAEIRGFAGCRAYTGTYRARDDEIGVTSITMASTECKKGEAALLREGQFTTDLSEASYYRLSGDSLELVTAGGRRLVFLQTRPDVREPSGLPEAPAQLPRQWLAARLR